MYTCTHPLLSLSLTKTLILFSLVGDFFLVTSPLLGWDGGEHKEAITCF